MRRVLWTGLALVLLLGAGSCAREPGAAPGDSGSVSDTGSGFGSESGSGSGNVPDPLLPGEPEMTADARLEGFFRDWCGHLGASADVSTEVWTETGYGEDVMETVETGKEHVELNTERMHLTQNMVLTVNGADSSSLRERWLVHDWDGWTQVRKDDAGWTRGVSTQAPEGVLPDLSGLLAGSGEYAGPGEIRGRRSALETAAFLGALLDSEELRAALELVQADAALLEQVPEASLVWTFDESSGELLSLDIDLSEAWQKLADLVTEAYVHRISASLEPDSVWTRQLQNFSMAVPKCRVRLSNFVLDDGIRVELPPEAESAETDGSSQDEP